MSDGARSEGQHSAFVWKTNKGHGDESPYFKTQQREFCLVFYTGWYEESDYRLVLHNKDPPPSPFDVSVFLIVGEESASAPCTTTVRQNGHTFVLRDYYTFVWKSTNSVLSKIDPDFERKTFRFVIFVHDPEHTEDKCVQTPAFFDAHFEIQSLSEDLSKLLDGDSRADVELKCGDVTFKAHRSLLSVRSEVFRAMLDSDMAERKTGQVQIVDAEAGLFRRFLRYLYTGKLEELTVDAAKGMYELGDKYSVEALKRQCVSFLVENLSHDNVCGILSMADRHTDGDLEEIATVYILDEKIPHQMDIWSDFCYSHPVLAIKILNRSYNLHVPCK